MASVATGAEPYVQFPETAEIRWMGTTATQFLATGDSTGGLFSLVDEWAEKGEEVPLHCHAGDWEAFYVLSGEVSFYLGDNAGVAVPSGGYVFVPAGTVHGFRILSDRARYLILTTPRHGEFYKAISFPANADRGPTGEPVTEAMIGAACETYGIDFLGPLPKG